MAQFPGRNREAESDSVATEVARGESQRTPFLAIGGVTIVIACVFAVVLTIVVAAYLIAR